MSNEINTFGSFNPMAQQAYQQFLYSQQQQYSQQQRSENPLYDSGYSLVYPEGYPPKEQVQNVNQNYFNNGLNIPYNNISLFNNDIFAGKYSNDIFAKQLLVSKPWENFSSSNPTNFPMENQITSQTLQNELYSSPSTQANNITFTI